jgi:hypothetical protein
MEINELIAWCENELKTKEYIIFTEEIFNEIDEEKALALRLHFEHKTFMLLPLKEINFFEWVKTADRAVWDDLWADDQMFDMPYIVGFIFLPLLVSKTRGFPICDLIEVDNYYFTAKHMVDHESEITVDSAKERFMNKSSLSVSQMLALEIHLYPIDIWRFSYNHRINLDEAKQSVKTLVDDNVLVHLTDAEHLATFIEI